MRTPHHRRIEREEGERDIRLVDQQTQTDQRKRKQYPDSPKPLDHTFVLCRFSFSKIVAAVFACCYYFSKCPQSEQMGVGKTQLEFYVASVYIAWSSLLFLLQCPFHLEDNDLNQQFFAKERSSTVKPQTQNSLSSS